MSSTRQSGRRNRRAARNLDIKDRLIQTRVPERLETVLKEEAKRRRLTVSHLIRNVLEDTLDLVDTVVSGAENLVGTSVEIAEQVARDARRISSTAREVVRSRAPEPAAPPTTADVQVPDGAAPNVSAILRAESPEPGEDEVAKSLEHVLAWNPVVVNRAAECARCRSELARGSSAHLGISSDPTAPPTWLCDACLALVR